MNVLPDRGMRSVQPGTFLLTSAVDTVDEVLVVGSQTTETLIREAKPIVEQAGAKLTVVNVPGIVERDRWMQDTVELGCTVVDDGGLWHTETSALLGLRTGHQGIDTGPLDEHMRQYLPARGIRCFEMGQPRVARDWIDWYGNLEVSPPVVSRDGQAFPWGRVLTGDQGGRRIHPGVLRFLERQGAQTPPLFIDTSWLLIGHVDEVVSFVPAPNKPGFKVLLPSPALSMGILDALSETGHGGEPLFEGTAQQCTVDDLVSDRVLRLENTNIDRRIESTAQVLCDAFGIIESDLVLLPALFRHGAALVPNPVNGLVCNRHVLMTNPLGPRVYGKDPFASATSEALEAMGVTVHFVDAWEAFHTGFGEIHCGTNTIRTPAYELRHGDVVY